MCERYKIIIIVCMMLRAEIDEDAPSDTTQDQEE